MDGSSVPSTAVYSDSGRGLYRTPPTAASASCAICGDNASPDYPLGNLCAPHAVEVALLKVRRDTADETLPIEDGQPVVYYLLFGDRVKIGTTRNLTVRLAQLPPGTLLGTEPGGRDVEQRRHRQFAGQRAAGREWFYHHPALAEHIARAARA